MKLLLLVIFTLYVTLYAGNKYDNMNIVFINGIMNDEDLDAIPSAKELSRAIGQPADRVDAVYNYTNGFLEDIAETYAYAKMDGTNGGKDFTKFWQLLRSKV